MQRRARPEPGGTFCARHMGVAPSTTSALDAMTADDALDLVLNTELGRLSGKSWRDLNIKKNYKFQSDFFLRHEQGWPPPGLCDAAAA